jgi:tripartite-type tricarboxylate transporter receptor subunit TctC
MMFERRSAFLAAVFAVVSGTAFGQAYPHRSITLVVPFAAGSGVDGIARSVAARLAERLKQPIVIDNRPGANAQIGAEYVAKAKPDGYTLLFTSSTSHSSNPSLFKNLRYDPIKDFTPIGRVGVLPFALVVSNAVPASNMKEFIDFAKANPGKISYAAPNSISLVSSETIRAMTNIDIVGVPYKSAPQALTDLLSGQIQMYVVDLVVGLTTMKAGRVRALGMTTARRSKLLPELPPIADTLPGFDIASWNGFFAPAGLPPAITRKVFVELNASLAEKEMQDKLANIGEEVLPSKSNEEFASYVVEQRALWAKLVEQADIKPE